MNNQKGFTLIEVAFVIAIIGVLIAFFAPSGATTYKDAEKLSTTTAISTLTTAEGMYIARNNKLPSGIGTNGGIAAMITDGELTGNVLKSIKNGNATLTNVLGNTAGEASAGSGNGYDLDSNGTVDTTAGEQVAQVKITGLTPAQADDINTAIDNAGTVINTSGGVPADTKGRVEFPAIVAAATGTVSIFVQRY